MKFRLFGFDWVIHWTWWALFCSMAVVDIAMIVGVIQPFWTSVTLLWLGTTLSISLHEVGHACAARHRKLHVEYIMLTFVGGLCLMKINETQKEDYPTQLFVTLAGTTITLVLIPLCIYSAGALMAFGYEHLAFYLFAMATINFWVLVINMIPIWPLDGGSVMYNTLAMKFPKQKVVQFRLVSSVVLAILCAITAFYLGFYVLGVISCLLLVMQHDYYIVESDTWQRYWVQHPDYSDGVQQRIMPKKDLQSYLDDFALVITRPIESADEKYKYLSFELASERQAAQLDEYFIEENGAYVKVDWDKIERERYQKMVERSMRNATTLNAFRAALEKTLRVEN